MMLYVVATLPMVHPLKGNGDWFQSQCVDDSVCVLVLLLMCIGGLIVCCY